MTAADERRRAHWFRLIAVLAALAMLVAACGGGDDDDDASGGDDPGTESTAGEDADIDENGTLQLAAAIRPNQALMIYDVPALPSPAMDIHQLIYDTLLQAQMDGTYEPGIATKAEAIDATTIEVTIREGVKFNDGSPLTPEDVRFSILRNRDAKNPTFGAELQEVSDVTVEGQKVTIKLKSPVAGIFYQFLGRGETMVMSKAAVEGGADHDTAPVGAGPYMIETIAAERELVLTKNPHHYAADEVRIPKITYTHVLTEDPQALVNGLRAKSFDFAPVASTVLSAEQVEAISAAGLKTQTEVSASTLLWGQICKKDKPLSDVRVRQALNYALDRDALNEVLYNGESEPAWGFWPSSHAFHNKELDGYYERDVKKAKKLLADAGYPDGFEMSTADFGFAITTTASEMVQQHWKEIGVDLKIVKSTDIVREFFNENKMDMYFFPLQRSGLDKVTRNLIPGNLGNVCNWEHPELIDLVTQLRAVPQSGNSPEAVKLWHRLEELAVSEAMNIFGVFGTVSTVWHESRLGDVELIPTFQGVPTLDIRDAYIKAS